MSNKQGSCNSIFAGWVNLSLYSTLVDTFREEGLYKFDLPSPDDFSIADVKRMLEEPEILSNEDLRAIALFTLGSDWECDGVLMEAVRRVSSAPDAFLESACAFSKNESVASVMLDSLRVVKRDSVEEYAISLLPFELSELDCTNLILEFMQMFANYTVPVSGNERFYFWVMKYHDDTGIRVDLFRRLYKALDSVSELGASVYDELYNYGFKIVPVCKIIYCVRKKCYGGRSYVKLKRSADLLASALAACTYNWTKDDKRFIELLHESRVGFPGIISISNYEWYYKKFGFDEAALKVDFNDELAVKRKRKVLAENDFNKLVLTANLPEDRLKSLKLTFKVWDPECRELFDVVGGEHHEWYDEDCSFSRLIELSERYGVSSDIVSFLVNNNHLWNLTAEVFCIVEQNLRERLSERYESVVRRFLANNRDFVLDGVAKEFYQIVGKFNMRLIEEFGVEQLRQLPESVAEYDSISEAVLRGCDITGICDEYYKYLDSFLRNNREFKQTTIMKFVKNFDVDTLSYHYENSDESVRLKRFYNSLAGDVYRSIKSVIGESMPYFVYRYEKVSQIVCLAPAIVSSPDAKYLNLVGTVLHRFLDGERLVDILNSVKRIETLTENSQFCEKWLSVVDKSVTELGQLNGFSINCGRIDGVECLLVSSGIVAAERVSVCVPCIVPDEDGELVSFFVGVPYHSVCIPGTQIVMYSDGEVTIKAKVYE